MLEKVIFLNRILDDWEASRKRALWNKWRRI